MTNPHLAYRPDIDGLRAIAILAVVGFHAFPEWVHGGFIGVDIFFVISGYLISGILLRGLATNDFSLAEFYARRIRRIFPALTLVLLSCLIFGWLALLADEYKMLGKHSAAGAAFFANFVFWSEAGYFDIASELKPLLHLWSLGIEEQFYIFWPVFLFLAYRLKLNLLNVMLLVSIISFSLNVGMAESNPSLTFYSPQTRIWELLFGSLLAYVNLHERERFDSFLSRIVHNSRHGTTLPGSITLINNFKSGLGLFFILLSVFALNKNHSFPGWWALLPTAGAFLIISAGSQAWLNQNLLASKALIFIGLISFPLYLWHWPLLSFARIMEPGVNRRIRFAAVVLSFLLAWLTYWLIEKQVRSRKHWSVPIALILAMSLVAGFGYNIYSRNGLGFRHKASENQAAVFKWDEIGLNQQDDCINNFMKLKQGGYCLQSNIRPLSVALIGDSHSNHWFYGLERYYAKSGQGLINLGSGGCPPFYNMESWRKAEGEVCRGKMNYVLDYVVNKSSIKTVVLAGGSFQYVSGNGYGNEMRESDFRLKFTSSQKTRDNADVFGQAMEYTLKQLLGAGKDVVFVVDIPELGFDPKACVESRLTKIFNRAPKNPCAVAKKEFTVRNQIYRAKVAEILQKFPAVKRWDPSTSLCDNQRCWAMKDGKMLYRDDTHLSLVGSFYLGEHFSPE